MKWIAMMFVWLSVTSLSAQATFRNPILPAGSDPSVVYKDGYYYYTHTLGTRIDLWKTKRLNDLKKAPAFTVWTAPSTGPNSKSIQAPRLYFLDGKWYLYYTATDVEHDSDTTRSVFVLENAAINPFEGSWVDKGKINTQHPGRHGSVFTHKGKHYFLYTATVGAARVLVVSRMVNPWTIEDREEIIARPELAWEKAGGSAVVEGPQFLAGPKGKVFIVYSAGACADDNHAAGMLTASATSDLADAASWKKSAWPVFRQHPKNNAYAPGQITFFATPDGKESWMLYHANTGKGQGCDRLSPRMQKYGWNRDGTPLFGNPMKPGMVLSAPYADVQP